jgi:hypothetical protein
MTQKKVIKRETRLQPHGLDTLKGYLVELVLWEATEKNYDGEWANPRPNVIGKYALKIIDEEMADVIRGEIPDTDGTPVMFIGNSFGKHFLRNRRRITNLCLLLLTDGGSPRCSSSL